MTLLVVQNVTSLVAVAVLVVATGGLGHKPAPEATPRRRPWRSRWSGAREGMPLRRWWSKSCCYPRSFSLSLGPRRRRGERGLFRGDRSLADKRPHRSAWEVEAFFDGLISRQLREGHVAGATVAVVRDGELVFAKGYGLADRERREPVVANETLFFPGSAGKPFTWTAVMQLVEEGWTSTPTSTPTSTSRSPRRIPSRSRWRT